MTVDGTDVEWRNRGDERCRRGARQRPRQNGKNEHGSSGIRAGRIAHFGSRHLRKVVADEIR